jgi:hypothetical protein
MFVDDLVEHLLLVDLGGEQRGVEEEHLLEHVLVGLQEFLYVPPVVHAVLGPILGDGYHVRTSALEISAKFILP